MAESHRHEPMWISEDEASKLLSLSEAIGVLADAYRGAAQEGAANLPRAHARRGERILHAVGGVVPKAGLAGTKTWLYTPGGASPVLILFRLEDGALCAVIEAFALGQHRTAATSGLGTSLLARRDADVLALLGTGKQALAQAQAVAAVRPLRRVQVFGRDATRRDDFCRRLRDELAVEVDGFDDVAATIAGAAVVTTITRAAEPIVFAGMLAPGMHVNAVGAIVPGRSELEPSAVGRCDVVVADSTEQAREDSGELNAAAGAGLLRFEDVVGLGDVAVDPRRGRRGQSDITLLKALGVGLSDVALGAELFARATKAGAGRPLPASMRAPHLQAPDATTRSKAHA